MQLVRKDKTTGISVKVEWSDLGEGIQGDYNPDDKDDVHLYRFDISVKPSGKRAYEAVDDASYCTQVPVDSSVPILRKGLEMIMDEIFDAVVGGNSIRKACERMSWLDVPSIQKGVWEGTGII